MMGLKKRQMMMLDKLLQTKAIQVKCPQYTSLMMIITGMEQSAPVRNSCMENLEQRQFKLLAHKFDSHFKLSMMSGQIDEWKNEGTFYVYVWTIL